MNYRLATILARKAIAADTVEDIDIDVKDPISQLVIVYDCKSVSSDDVTGHPAECLTKIELIDGSNVLYSLSGVEAQAVDFYHNKVEPANDFRYIDGGWSYMVFNLNFGRYLWDTELALDPTRFGNLKLRITIDVSAGGIAAVEGRLMVLAHLFDQKSISPIGFFMHKEIKSYTLASGSHEYTDMPLDFPYRKLFIRAQRDSYNITRQIANVKLSEDVDKVVPINLPLYQMIRAMTSQVRPYREGIVGWGTNALTYFFCTPAYAVTFGGATWRETATTRMCAFYDGDGGYFSHLQDTGVGNWSCNLQGWLPHAVFEIPFGMQNEIADWYDVSGIGNLKLDLTGGTSVGTAYAQIMLQQLRRY